MISIGNTAGTTHRFDVDGRPFFVFGSDVTAIHAAFGRPPATEFRELMHGLIRAAQVMTDKGDFFPKFALALAEVPDVFKEFDAAQRLGADTFTLQQILLRGLGGS